MKNDRNNKIIMWMLGICLAISLVFVGQESSQKSQLQTKYEKLDAKYQDLKEKKELVDSWYDSSQEDYSQLETKYDTLQEDYDDLQDKYDSLKEKYKKKTAKPKAVSAKAKSSNSSSNSSSSNSSSDDSSTSADVIVHITDYGSKYHAAGCRYLSKSDITISKSEAEQRGVSPCSVCNP